MWDHRFGSKLKGICGVMAVAVILCGCGQKETPDDLVVIEQEEMGPSYEFGVAEIGDVVKTVKITCTYRQVDEQEVAFQVDGRLVDRVYVEEGDTVNKGDLLAELSSRDLERRIEDLEYRIARNELLLSYADTNESYAISRHWVDYLDKNSWMTTDDLNSRIENTQQNYRYQREDYTDALTVDRAELEKLQRELKSSRVYASMDGVVYDLKDDLKGSTSKQGEVVMTIMDTSERLFETSVSDALSYFSEGEPISMSIVYSSAAGQYVLMPWHMEEWGDTQLFVVYEGQEGSALEVGMSGTMQVVQDRRENVLMVPLSAVLSAEDRTYVYVMDADNMREVRWVETGLYGDTTVEILSGLTEGERVILK